MQLVATWVVNFFWPNAVEVLEDEQIGESRHNLRAKVKRFVEKRGGLVIVWSRVTRAFGGLVLLTLTLLAPLSQQHTSQNLLRNQDGDWSENLSQLDNRDHDAVRKQHMINLSFAAVYVCTLRRM